MKTARQLLQRVSDGLRDQKDTIGLNIDLTLLLQEIDAYLSQQDGDAEWLRTFANDAQYSLENEFQADVASKRLLAIADRLEAGEPQPRPEKINILDLAKKYAVEEQQKEGRSLCKGIVSTQVIGLARAMDDILADALRRG